MWNYIDVVIVSHYGNHGLSLKQNISIKCTDSDNSGDEGDISLSRPALSLTTYFAIIQYHIILNEKHYFLVNNNDCSLYILMSY